ncbi:zinc-ribbon domain-containing protein [Microcoleus sp. ZQ-A2]|nr:DEAD/DEAH box helicase family protein [Microcoleus sp. FACHB-1]
MKDPLSITHPQLAAQWHPTRNGVLTPDRVTAGSNKKAWWICSKGSDHEWEAIIGSRTRLDVGCPFCAGKNPSVTNSLVNLYPEIAKEWHPTKNGTLTPDQVVAGSGKRVWWKCPNGSDHEWEGRIAHRSRGSGCPFCRGLKSSVTNSLANRYPEIAEEWHPTKNGTLTPDQVVAGSQKKAWWICPNGSDHEWEAIIYSRVIGNGCPFCSGKKVSVSNSLASLYPQIAKEWHPEKNGKLTSAQVVAGSNKTFWWKCIKAPDHEWKTSIAHRVDGTGCPFCSSRKLSVTNSLASRCPEIAKEWHPTKNGSLTPDQVIAGIAKKVWWRCSIDPSHEWEALISNRTQHGRGCPACNSGWTVQAIRTFVASLINHLKIFTPAELYLLLQQSGLLQTQGKSKSFVKALATGRFPNEEIEKFVDGEPSTVDKFLQDKQLTLEALEISSNHDIPDEGDVTSQDNLDDQIDETVEPSEEDDDLNLPLVQTREVLASLDHSVVFSADEEAVEFLIASAKAKIWKHVFRDESAAVAQAQSYTGDSYAQKVRAEFLDEYHRAKNLPIPTGYNFRINGKIAEPNLMQRLAAVQVRDKKRVGNWSGTGAGKTLSAVLASRVINAHLTVICCPNSVVEGWEKAILDIFPDSVVAKKTFTPDWTKAASNETQISGASFSPLNKGGRGGLQSGNQPKNPQYLILNYEMFQQPNSANWVRRLINNQQIDFIVIDEIHYTKQRQVEDISKRKQLVSALITAAAERNPDLHIIGMSATPVINNLQEGKSLVELITGVHHNELDIRPTLPNCMRLHQRLVTLGIRWKPEYNLSYEQLEIPVDCEEFLEDIRALGRNGTPLELEKILTRARLPIIRRHIQPKTLIYTHYIQGIDKLLRDALTEDGWNVGFYTGEDKSGLEGFLNGNIDVLIGSSAIGTGVDGLQHVCNQLIINVLPWTHAEFEQLKGRIYRQGQRQDKVTLIIPLTYADVNGQRWSWCDSKMQRLRFKKSIADAAVDGIVPEGHLRTPAQAYQDIIAWLERLETGQVEAISRQKMIIPLPDDDPADVQRRQHRYGDFSTLNRLWNQSRSDTTHQRLQANPEEWAHYHTLYQESRTTWSVIPYEEMIRWCQQRSGYAIADFGCGEAKLAEAVSDRHTVYSFDHVAINNNVIACDMAHVPLNDEELDVAIFSLSLMGSNFSDYLREAHRTLKLDGQLHIIEATSRFSNLTQFRSDLEALGFDVVSDRKIWKFTHIRALKTERRPQDGVKLGF